MTSILWLSLGVSLWYIVGTYSLERTDGVLSGERVDQSLVDLSSRTGYSILGVKPKDARARACEYYQYDWEYAQTPEESSLIASSWVNWLHLKVAPKAHNL